MRTRAIIAGAIVAALAGCGSMPEERAISGSAIGAGAGAALGAVTGMSVATGALIGAATGALAGGLTRQDQINLGEPAWKPGAGAPMTSVAGHPAPANNQVVNSIQTSLNRLGYQPGPVDGRFGVRTQNAIRDYQRDHGLLEDGRATPELADHMWSQGRPRPSVQEGWRRVDG
ncbi:MAG: peptidoglycan-binding domain-containing protein [Candidatus Binatia bacterium]